MIFEKLRKIYTNDQILDVINVTSKSIYTQQSLKCGDYEKYNQPPSKLIIEPKNNVWGTDKENGQWLEFDFRKKVLINGIAIKSTTYCNYPTSYSVLAFIDDENIFKEQKKIENKDLKDTTKIVRYYFDPIKTNRIKIMFHDGKSSQGDNYITLYMVDFLGVYSMDTVNMRRIRIFHRCFIYIILNVYSL